MTKPNRQTATASSAATTPVADTPHVMKPSTLLSFLWDNFDPQSLSVADLEFLSVASEEASTMCEWLAKHVNGVSCLIDTDRQEVTPFVRSGAMQDDEQPSLLNFVASQIEVIGELARIGGEASFMLRNRLINGGRHD